MIGQKIIQLKKVLLARRISCLVLGAQIELHFRYSKQFLEIAHSKMTSTPEVQARVLYGLGYVMFIFNEYDRAIELLNESLNICRSRDNLQEQVFVLAQLASFHKTEGSDVVTRLNYSKQGLDIARRLGKPGLINRCLQSVCQELVMSKQFEKAIPYVEELLASSESMNQPTGNYGSTSFSQWTALLIRKILRKRKNDMVWQWRPH